MIGDRYYITLGAAADGVCWDLRKGNPEGFSVRIKGGVAFSWAAAAHQAGDALQGWALGAPDEVNEEPS